MTEVAKPHAVQPINRLGPFPHRCLSRLCPIRVGRMFQGKTAQQVASTNCRLNVSAIGCSFAADKPGGGAPACHGMRHSAPNSQVASCQCPCRGGFGRSSAEFEDGRGRRVGGAECGWAHVSEVSAGSEVKILLVSEVAGSQFIYAVAILCIPSTSFHLIRTCQVTRDYPLHELEVYLTKRLNNTSSSCQPFSDCQSALSSPGKHPT